MNCWRRCRPRASIHDGDGFPFLFTRMPLDLAMAHRRRFSFWRAWFRSIHYGAKNLLLPLVQRVKYVANKEKSCS